MNQLNSQSGFSAVEALLILVIVGILGFTGWYVYAAQKNSAKLYTVTTSHVPSFKKQTVNTPPTQPVFTGVITADECVTSKLPIGDVGCYITVNGNIKIVVQQGNMRSQQPWGKLINFPGFPKDPTGSKVTVFAQKIDNTDYTLAGSAGYYVKIN